MTEKCPIRSWMVLGCAHSAIARATAVWRVVRDSEALGIRIGQGVREHCHGPPGMSQQFGNSRRVGERRMTKARPPSTTTPPTTSWGPFVTSRFFHSTVHRGGSPAVQLDSPRTRLPVAGVTPS